MTITTTVSKTDFIECEWCMNQRAQFIVTEPIEITFYLTKTNMCEDCLRMKKQIFPFELCKYEVIKYRDGG